MFSLFFLSVNINNLIWQIKRLLTLNNIETNIINKKQSQINLTHMMLLIDESFKCEYFWSKSGFFQTAPNCNFMIPCRFNHLLLIKNRVKNCYKYFGKVIRRNILYFGPISVGLTDCFWIASKVKSFSWRKYSIKAMK